MVKGHNCSKAVRAVEAGKIVKIGKGLQVGVMK